MSLGVVMKWCEGCRDHFPESHYDENDSHRIGEEFGSVGRWRAIEVEWARYRKALEEIVAMDDGEEHGFSGSPDWYCALGIQADIAREALNPEGSEKP